MRKIRFGKAKLAVAAAAATVGVLASGSPAGATQWNAYGLNDMRGVVVGTTPQFGCNAYGSIAVSPLYIKSASNTGLYVYETVYSQYMTNSGYFVDYNPAQASPIPNGIYVPRNGATQYLPGHTWSMFQAYWHLRIRLDFYNDARQYIGEVVINGVSPSDYGARGISNYCRAF